jgi:cytoplasmic FMR1 interacting protein
LETQLAVLRETHTLLSQHFEQLLPFESLFVEANQSMNPLSSHSRIIFHVIFELSKDLFPNHTYNSVTQRFVRASISFGDQADRGDAVKSNVTMLYGSKVHGVVDVRRCGSPTHVAGTDSIVGCISVVERGVCGSVRS